MLRALSIITMRQEHNETVLDVPLLLTRANELIDHDLSTVSEVTKLSLPKDESVRVGLGIAILETKDSVLREMRVGSDEVSCLISRGKHTVDGHVAAILVLVEHVSVSVREGSTLNILSRKTHVVAFVDEGSESKRLSSTPVNSLSAGNSILTGLEDLDNLRVELLVLRQVGDLFSNSFQIGQIDTSVLERSILGLILDLFPLISHPVFLLEGVALGLLVGFLKSVEAFFIDSIQSLSSDSLIDEFLTIDVSGGLLTLDNLVHQGLGESGLIELVVTHLSVGNQINHNILVECLSVLSSNLESLDDVLKTVSVNVEDGGVDSLGDIRSIHARSATVRSGSETNLVVDDDVEGTTDGVVLEILHLKALVDDTLASHGGVTVDNDGDNLLAVLSLATEEVLLSASSSGDDRVDSLQVRWVSQKRQLDGGAIIVSSLESSSQMIFDITRAHEFVSLGLWGDTLELGHDDLSRLAHDVGKHVESTSVRHTNNILATTVLGQSVNGDLQTGDESLSSIEAKTLHGVELGGQEGSPLVGPVQATVVSNLLLLSALFVLDALKLVSDPVALFTVGDMHKLNADLSTVSILISLQKISQLPLLLFLQDRAILGEVNVEGSVQVSLSEPVVSVIEQSSEFRGGESEFSSQTLVVFVNFSQFQRINIRNQMAVSKEGADKN